jgi:hypothetical protein
MSPHFTYFVSGTVVIARQAQPRTPRLPYGLDRELLGGLTQQPHLSPESVPELQALGCPGRGRLRLWISAATLIGVPDAAGC